MCNNGFCGNNLVWIIILAILFCGWGNNGTGLLNNNGCGCGCGCANNDNGCGNTCGCC